MCVCVCMLLGGCVGGVRVCVCACVFTHVWLSLCALLGVCVCVCVCQCRLSSEGVRMLNHEGTIGVWPLRLPDKDFLLEARSRHSLLMDLQGSILRFHVACFVFREEAGKAEAAYALAINGLVDRKVGPSVFKHTLS